MKRFFLFLTTLCFFRSLCFPAIFINHTGFETGDASEVVSTAGTFSVQTATVHTGTYAFRSNPTGTAAGDGVLEGLSSNGSQAVTSTAAANACVDFYFKYLTKPAANNEEFFTFYSTASAVKLNLRLNSSGNMVFYNSALTALSTGTTVLTSGTWYLVSARCGSGTSAVWEVDINSVLESSGTSNLSGGGTGGIALGKAINRAGNSVDFYYDDVALTNGTTFVGTHQVSLLFPNANGTYQNFSIGAGSGSHYQVVDDIPPNGNTDYLVSSTFGNKEVEAALDSCGIVNGTINAVKAVYSLANGGGGTGIEKMILRSNTTDDTFGDAGTSTAYALWAKDYNTDPATNAAWTFSGVDGVQTGAQEGDGDGFTFSRMSFTGIMVDYVPGSSNACAGATPISGGRIYLLN